MTVRPFPNLKGTIFVVTYGRSGSTVLQSILQSIPGAHIVGENYGALEGLFRSAQAVRRARQSWGRKAHPMTHPWYGADRLRPNRFEQQLAQVFIDEVIQPPPDARWIGFKEIRYQRVGDEFTPFLNFCRRTFPNPFFVFNSRAGADVAQSKWWANQPPEKVLEMVATMDARFAAFAEAHPDVAHRVFHEDTCADLSTLAPLFDKLDEPFDVAAAQRVLDTPLTH